MPVYVLAAGDTPMTKIGWAASDVPGRVRELQAGCWEPLRVLRVVEGGRLVEAWFHRRFLGCRVVREWFTFDPAMLTVEPPVVASSVLPDSPAQRIADRFGGQSALAKAVGCSQGTVWGWIKQGRVPSARVVEIITAGRDLSPPVALTPNDFFDSATAGCEAA